MKALAQTPKPKKKRAKPTKRMTFQHPQFGKLLVYEFADRTVRGESIELSDAAEDGQPVWIHIAKPGFWKGHPAGPFELNFQVFEEIVANFRATQNRHIPFDFEHASEAPATEGSVPAIGAPAQGWIIDLRIDSAGLWGLVEWGELARSYIKDKKYRYVSPAIRFNSKDRVTAKNVGARLTSCALTNCPFLDGLQPVAAKDSAMFAYSSHEYMPAIRAALRLPELSTARDCAEALAKIQQYYEAANGEPTHGVDVPGYVDALKEMTKAPLTATVQEIFHAVKALIEAAIEEHEALQHPENAGADDAELTDSGNPPIEQEKGDPPMELENVIASKDKQIAELTLMSDTSHAEAAKLALQLKESQAQQEMLADEVRALREWKATREELDLLARVDEAFETYKDAKRLSDADKVGMTVVLRHDAQAFDAMYPRVRMSEQHLLRTLVKPNTNGEKPELPQRVSLSERAKQLAYKHGISIGEAMLLAARDK